MTQQALYRMAGFRAGSLPDAKAHPDSLIVVHSVDLSQSNLYISDGRVWRPVATVPVVASTAEAIAGTDNETVITPLRLNEVLAGLGLTSVGGNTYVDAGYVDSGYVN